LLGNLADIKAWRYARGDNHNNIQPVYDVYVSNQDRDLGAVSRDIGKIIKQLAKKVPTDRPVIVQGQVATMNQSFLGLGAGLIFAVLIIDILLVVELRILGRPVRDYGGVSGHAVRCRMDAVHDANDI